MSRCFGPVSTYQLACSENRKWSDFQILVLDVQRRKDPSTAVVIQSPPLVTALSVHTLLPVELSRSLSLSHIHFISIASSLSLSPMRLSTWHSESGCFWSESEIVLSCWWGGSCISFLFGAPTGSRGQPMQTGNCWFAWSADDIGSAAAEAFRQAHTFLSYQQTLSRW